MGNSKSHGDDSNFLSEYRKQRNLLKQSSKKKNKKGLHHKVGSIDSAIHQPSITTTPTKEKIQSPAHKKTASGSNFLSSPHQHFLYTLSTSAPMSTVLQHSPSPLSNNGSPSSSLSNQIYNNTSLGVEQQPIEILPPEQLAVSTKLRKLFPSFKNVPDFFLNYFSVVLSDETTLRETFFANTNDIGFYLEMQSKIEDLFLECEEVTASRSPLVYSQQSTPTSSSLSISSSVNARSPVGDYGSLYDSASQIDPEIITYGMGILVDSNDASENITTTGLPTALEIKSNTNNFESITSSIVNYHRDFLNPFHIVSRNELGVRLVILPRIFKNVFYSKSEVAQIISPIFSQRNNLHFRDAFIQTDEHVICIVVGCWILEYLVQPGIVVPKLIYASSEVFSHINSLPLIAMVDNSNGKAFDTIVSTIIRWNTGKQDPNSTQMSFIDDLLKSLNVKFKWTANPTLENFRNGSRKIEWTIPAKYNLLKTPNLGTPETVQDRVVTMKSIEDFEATIPKIVQTMSNDMIISKAGYSDYLSIMRKSQA